MDDKLKFGLVGLLVGGLVVWTVFSNNSAYQRQSIFKNQNSNMMSSSTIDAHFIEQMIPHHEDAITMAKMALDKSQRPEIKDLAQNIIDSQTKENEQMRSWYKNWFGRDLPTGQNVMMNHGMMSNAGMHMGMMGNESDIDSLENAANFDQEFIEEMIPHHQMAVMMASMLRAGTQRPEMKNLADDIITAQTKEIDEMRKWYRDWGY